MMFMSPIFYPKEAIPDNMKMLAELNPLAVTIENTRLIAIQGEMPSMGYLICSIIMAIVYAEVCFRFIKRAQNNMGDYL